MLKKIFIRGLVVLISIPFLIIILMIALNWRDQDLLPEVQSALNWKVPAHAFDDNGFLIIAGMNAPKEDDAGTHGKKKVELDVARFVKYQKTHQENYAQDDAKTTSENALDISELNKQRCDYRKEKSCLAFYLKQDPQNQQALIANNQLLSSRLAAAKASRRYVEVIPPMLTSMIPSYSYVMNAMELERMIAIREIEAGQEAQGIARLIENNQFSQRMLTGSYSLIAHMVTIASMQRDIRLMSELVQTYPQLAKQSAQIAPMLINLNNKPMSLEKAFDFERAGSLQIFFNLDKDPNYLLDNINEIKLDDKSGEKSDDLGNINKSKIETFTYRLVFRPNAGVNLAYAWHGALVDLGNKAPHEFDAAYIDKKKKQDQLMGWGISPLHLYFQDPVAKILLQVAEPDYQNYSFRHFDTQGQLNLLALQLKIVSEKLDDAQIAALLQKNEVQYQNPYTLQAMQWDAKDRIISFEGRAKRNQFFGDNNIISLHIVTP